MTISKQELRQETWNILDEAGVGAFPFPLEGRIPNFKGSNDAARLLAKRVEFVEAGTVKANPDAPQRKARELAVATGKHLFMAVPRLRSEHPFRKIEAREVAPRKAVTLKGSREHSQPRYVEELPILDLIIVGSVAVHPDGRRLGKGGGYSDLEFALLVTADKITSDTVVATTVHPLQCTEREIPFDRHDVPVDLIVTPDEVIRTQTTRPRPDGIYPKLLTPKQRREIPALARLLENG